MSEPAPVLVAHPALSCVFQGISKSFFNTGGTDVWQFRGIEYGTIPARFQQAVLNEHFPSTFNATLYRQKCPQVVTGTRLEEVLIGTPPGKVPENMPDLFDEYHCLNLNISTPPGAREGNDFPVLVYIHGGGGTSGSNSDWWCDPSGLVGKSITMEKPVVVVAINYRLSVFGNLGSEEMRKVNGEQNGGNFAFRDMHLALEWVHKYIGPFGGSCSDITTYGESFGSLGVETLLHSELYPRFSKAILQSQVLGAPLLTNPETIAAKSATYEKVKKYLGLTTLHQLQTVNWQDLLKAYVACDPRAGLPQVPMIDGIVLSENWRDNYNFSRGRSGAVMIGTTGYEGAVIEAVLVGAPKSQSPPTTKTLIDSAHAALPNAPVGAILSEYQIFEQTALAEVRPKLLTILEDLAWYIPTAELAQKLQDPHPNQKTTVYQYSFQHLNPFQGPFKGKSVHALDLAYLHGDPDMFIGTEQTNIELQSQEVFKGHWGLFADGEIVWDPKQMMEFGPHDLGGPVDMATFLKEKRRSDRWESFKPLSFADKEVFTGILFGHLSQLNGV
ncbi:Alpha/Beta hydrolase protein [Leptodontidium sp. MPI-SDFR-AT-0119]|nr:Alpha/Beta hydrolase protein [Leptodontidium sp. MPI-SDFR-AT-0119]